MIKRIGIIIAGLAALLVMLAVAAPLVMSSQTVKARIEAQLSDVTGRRVRLAGDSALSFSPYLGVTYFGVTIGQIPGETKPLVAIEEMQAQLGFFALLRGDIRLSKLTLVRPRLSLSQDAAGRSNWVPVSGRLQRILDTKDETAAAAFSFGQITIVDGIIEHRSSDGAQWELTALNGTLNWPTLMSAAETQFTAVWRGEIVSVSGTVDTPFAIITGASSPLVLEIDAKPLKLTYNGTAEDVSLSVLKGDLTLETPSLPRLAAWLERRETIANRLGRVTLKAKLSSMANEATLDEAVVTINEDEAAGRLQILETAGANLKLSGTLAFETLTLPKAVDFQDSAINADTATSDDTNTNTPTGPLLNFTFLETIDLDLRLSAAEARNEAITMRNVAATLLVSEGRGSVDIGSADAFGGTVSGALAVEPSIPHLFSIDMRLRGVDMNQLAAVTTPKALSLNGTADVRFKLRTRAHALSDFAAGLNGEGTLDSKDGALVGFDLASIVNSADDLTRERNIFSGQTAFETLRVGFFVSEGTAFFRETTLGTADYQATLMGKADLARRTVAFRGDVTQLTSADENPAPVVPFFIGGIVDAPLFAPLPRRLAEPENKPEPDEAGDAAKPGPITQ